MDTAYDHIQEETFPKEVVAKEAAAAEPASLNTELKEAYNAVASSPWAATLGGFWGSVKKVGEQYIEEAQKTTTAAGSQASKGIAELINRTRSLSLTKPNATTDAAEGDAPEAPPAEEITPHPDRPESLPADIVREAQSFVSRFRSEAAKRLKDIERAEDAADEALLRLGTNIRSFLQDAVSIAPPTEVVDADAPGRLLFESRDADGRRTIHTNRLDAQLHVIHCSLDSFLRDPAGPEYEAWVKEFDAGGKTAAIAADLEKYDELRRAMEKLVPEKVEYPIFWRRYYFLKRVAELEEQRRKELLKGAASGAGEEVGWDEESDDEAANTPVAAGSTTLQKPAALKQSDLLKPNDLLKPSIASPRSHDVLSQPDSDASYDIVSGAPSRAGGSPKQSKIDEHSDEEDWE